MSGQVDVGWTAPPLGLDALADNRIRIIACSRDVAVRRDQTIRALVTTVDVLKKRRDAINRFVAAYRETIDWMYTSDDALKAYAELAKVSFAKAKRVRDEFFPMALVWPDKIAGLDAADPGRRDVQIPARASNGGADRRSDPDSAARQIAGFRRPRALCFARCARATRSAW